MAVNGHQTYIYIGLAGEGEYIGVGGMYRQADGVGEWQSITNGLPENPQVRSLLIHPDNPKILYAGTQSGPYRSDDRGNHWEALEAPEKGTDVWSLAFHPHDPNIVYAGYEPCAIYRSDDSGASWKKTNTERVIFPHITTYMPPTAKRVIEIAADPSDPTDVYAAIEVGGLLASRDGGESWEGVTEGPYLKNNTLDLHGVQISPAAPGTVFIATQVAMFRSPDRGHHWEHVKTEEMFPGGSYCRDLLVASDDPKTIYLAASAGGGGSPSGTVDEGALFRSRDLGETWHRLDIGDTPPSRMFEVAIDRSEPSHVYACTYSGQIYASHDGGDTWNKTLLPVETSRSRHVYPMACG